MKIISHRGNLDGPDSFLENKMNAIDNALDEGFAVEIDLWYLSNQFLLGHDEPKTHVSLDQIRIWSKKNDLYCHCKNIWALEKIITSEKASDAIPFFHNRDQCILLKNNLIWVHPNAIHNCVNTENSIIVLPDCKTVKFLPNNFYGICTDYPRALKESL